MVIDKSDEDSDKEGGQLGAAEGRKGKRKTVESAQARKASRPHATVIEVPDTDAEVAGHRRGRKRKPQTLKFFDGDTTDEEEPGGVDVAAGSSVTSSTSRTARTSSPAEEEPDREGKDAFDTSADDSESDAAPHEPGRLVNCTAGKFLEGDESSSEASSTRPGERSGSLDASITAAAVAEDTQVDAEDKVADKEEGAPGCSRLLAPLEVVSGEQAPGANDSSAISRLRCNTEVGASCLTLVWALTATGKSRSNTEVGALCPTLGYAPGATGSACEEASCCLSGPATADARPAAATPAEVLSLQFGGAPNF